MSREVGRIVTDLPVELNLDEGRTGRYDRRAVAQRFRELEFRTLIDRLPPSSIAPTGYGPAEQETGGGLQLSLDLLGGAGAAARTAAGTAAETAARERPGCRPATRAERSSASTRGSSASDADRARARRMAGGTWREGCAGLGRRGRAGRWSARYWASRWPGEDGSTWYLPWSDDRPLPAWFDRDDRPLIGHDLKQLVTMLAARGVQLIGPAFDTLVASYMVNPALRAQTLDDLAANRFGATLPDKPAADVEADDAIVARRAAAEALTSLLARPALEA